MSSNALVVINAQFEVDSTNLFIFFLLLVITSWALSILNEYSIIHQKLGHALTYSTVLCYHLFLCLHTLYPLISSWLIPIDHFISSNSTYETKMQSYYRFHLRVYFSNVKNKVYILIWLAEEGILLFWEEEFLKFLFNFIFLVYELD